MIEHEKEVRERAGQSVPPKKFMLPNTRGTGHYILFIISLHDSTPEYQRHPVTKGPRRKPSQDLVLLETAQRLEILLVDQAYLSHSLSGTMISAHHQTQYAQNRFQLRLTRKSFPSLMHTQFDRAVQLGILSNDWKISDIRRSTR